MSRFTSSVRRAATTAALALASAGLLAGCSDSPSGARGDGRVSILLTDAPGDFRSAVVTISEIYLQGEGGRVVLMDTPVTTDLLTLANSTAELVKDAVVPAGHYSQLRFVVTGGYIEVENAEGGVDVYATEGYAELPSGVTPTGVLHMPSYSSSGLKVKLPGGGVDIEGEATVMLVDFDVSRSFGREAGSSGRWVMSPVLEATDFSFSGGVTVSARLGDEVELPTIDGTPMTLGAVKAVLSNADGAREEMLLTDEDGDGVWEAPFRYVLPGAWEVSLEGPEGVTLTTDPAQPAAVTITAGQTAAQAFVVTGASYEPPAEG